MERRRAFPFGEGLRDRRSRDAFECAYEQSRHDGIDRIAPPEPREQRPCFVFGGLCFDRDPHGPCTTGDGAAIEGAGGTGRRARENRGRQRTRETHELARPGAPGRRSAFPNLDAVAGAFYEIGHDSVKFTIDSVYRHYFYRAESPYPGACRRFARRSENINEFSALGTYFVTGNGRASATGYIRLGTRIAGALGRIALDRLAEGLGAALPRNAQQLARPEVVDELVRCGTPSGQAPIPPLRSVSLPGIEFESSNCSNFLLDVEFEPQSESESGCGEGWARPLPKTLYAKLPCRQIGTRAFANAVGFWQVEATFCERIASQLPIRVPRVVAVAQRGARFVLLLENLQEVPGARLFINRDMAAGTTPERARMCLSTFAELHAGFWGWGAAQREALLPLRLHPFLGPGGRAMTRALNSAAISPAHEAAPDLFTKQHVDTFRLAIDKWNALIDIWYGDPLTLIHGDSHLANCFEYPTSDGPRMGLIDFQGLQWCRGIRDVQYHLINSLEPEVLAEHEDELIDHYVAELGVQGVELAAEDAREQYRALSFQTLMVAVVSIGLGSLTERDATIRTLLRRSVSAIDRLAFREWLEGI